MKNIAPTWYGIEEYIFKNSFSIEISIQQLFIKIALYQACFSSTVYAGVFINSSKIIYSTLHYD